MGIHFVYQIADEGLHKFRDGAAEACNIRLTFYIEQ